MRLIKDVQELKSLIGQEVAISTWMTITQEKINQFAQATDDRQWIHLDTERCRTDSPYGSTIAHGFFIVSLVPGMMAQSVALSGVRMVINYGVNKIRFPAPVPVDSRIRMLLKLLDVEEIEKCLQGTWQVVVECEGSLKPVCVAEPILRWYF